MSSSVIRVENLSKRYRIGPEQARYGSLRESLNNAISAPLQRFKGTGSFVGSKTAQTIWAVKDISFEVKQGEVLGIIGRNGAGKSTLLKILARITKPTTGRVHLYGRVGSLLEVGTGFHPELTGRENIFLNGAVLGMKRTEIQHKFDEIINFAEIEQFLDTPVKHYSSGMYMRLAFAVAAHLNPEILLIDEVLAVGDTAFQKKCLGKMGEISKEGRTILFVSHNMAIIQGLCNRVLLLDHGKIIQDTDVEKAIKAYLNTNGALPQSCITWSPGDAPHSAELIFQKVSILDDDNKLAVTLDNRKPFFIEIEYEIIKHLRGLRIGFSLRNGENILICGSNDMGMLTEGNRDPGRYRSRCKFPGYILNEGMYYISLGSDLYSPTVAERLVFTENCLSFTVQDIEGHGPVREKLSGIIRPDLAWSVTTIT